MSFLHSLLSLPREGLVISAVVVAALLAVCLGMMFSRRRFIVIKKSEETELLAFHLRRISDALERLAATRENHTPLDESPDRSVSMSLPGR